MKNKKLIVLLPALFLAFGTTQAQDDEAPERYTYATYMYCDSTKEAAADAYVKDKEAPVMDKLVDDGELLAWGWLRHHTGGKWRRIRYMQSDSLNGAVGAIETMSEALEAALGDDDTGGVGEACKGHEDYVWQVESGMSGVERGKAGLSVYFMCKIGEEGHADDIVAKHFAPVYNKLVEDGKLTSWGWQSHVLGGHVRRLLTMSAKDFDAVLDARAEALNAMPSEAYGPGAAFSKICGKHEDYLWDIVHEKQAGS